MLKSVEAIGSIPAQVVVRIQGEYVDKSLPEGREVQS